MNKTGNFLVLRWLIFTGLVTYNISLCEFSRDSAAASLATNTEVFFDPPKLPESTPLLSVEFHVLLSKEEWLWDDSAKVYLRFGHHLLGGFLCCHGPMDVIKYVCRFVV